MVGFLVSKEFEDGMGLGRHNGFAGNALGTSETDIALAAVVTLFLAEIAQEPCPVASSCGRITAHRKKPAKLIFPHLAGIAVGKETVHDDVTEAAGSDAVQRLIQLVRSSPELAEPLLQMVQLLKKTG